MASVPTLVAAAMLQQEGCQAFAPSMSGVSTIERLQKGGTSNAIKAISSPLVNVKHIEPVGNVADFEKVVATRPKEVRASASDVLCFWRVWLVERT